jgi:D-glycero-D-manno-heptose 1,7-bisphosphate phosphatase
MSSGERKCPAVFLDRDGTLMEDVDYCGDPKDVRVFDGAGKALRKLKERGYKLVVITNQSGIARGYFTEEQYKIVEHEVAEQLGKDLIDASYFCPHHPNDQCACRKPSAEMVVRAARDHALDLGLSFFVGDKMTDLEAGRNAGVKTVLVRTGYGGDTDSNNADLVAEDLTEAASLILNHAT